MSATPSVSTQLLSDVEQYVAELQNLESAKRLAPDTLESVYALAYQQIQHGRIQQAREYLALLLVYAPADTRFLSAMAHCCEHDGNTDEAIHLYSLALFIAPQSCALALALAQSLMRRGAVDAATQLLEKIARIGSQAEDAKYRARAELWLHALAQRSTSTV